MTRLPLTPEQIRDVRKMLDYDNRPLWQVNLRRTPERCAYCGRPATEADTCPGCGAREKKSDGLPDTVLGYEVEQVAEPEIAGWASGPEFIEAVYRWAADFDGRPD